jgi:hypothetical protein
MILHILQGLLGDGRQLDYFYSWLKIAWETLLAGLHMPGQAMAIAGPINSGKSLLQSLITEILGGRNGKPYQYMAGETPFNADLIRAEHLIIEDEQASPDLRTRRKLGSHIKNITVNGDQRCHQKGRTPVMLRPFWRLSISLNDQPEDLLVLPPIDRSLGDKIMLFRAKAVAMPMPTSPAPERKVFYDALVAELPAFLHWLGEWSIPEDIKCDRYGVKAYHHPDLLKEIDANAPEARLLQLIDDYVLIGRDVWEGTARGLEAILTAADSRCNHQARQLFTQVNTCGTYLGRLADKHPDRVIKARKSEERRWIIKAGTLSA